jgi:argininosuccinate lyase
MKPWGGRFKGKTDPILERFSASIDFDRALYRYDIEGSKAHAEMLGKIGVLSKKEMKDIVTALNEIRKEIEAGIFTFSSSLEDIHMHIEARLIEKTGDAGKKLHTGRSRNDQVSLDMRMYLKDRLKDIEGNLMALLKNLVQKTEKEKTAIMPGYTHMQRAQVVPFSHYLMAYYYMFKRDRERMQNILQGVDVMPLGSGALAGSTMPLDRDFVRKKLGFARVSENSMDAVSDRDFVVDAIYGVAMIMMHLSRLSEDLIIFSSNEVAFVSLPDELCTGSSLMPHKKNPDALELIRGKTSRVIGDLFSIFSILKGLPMTYNRDLQEDKEPLFHSVETAKDALAVMALCIAGMKIDRKRMERAVSESFMPAVEMAEYLTLKGVPFREAHGVVGRLVRDCEEQGKTFKDLTVDELKRFSPLFEKDVFACIDPQTILKNRKTEGAASFKEVERQINAEKIYCNR